MSGLFGRRRFLKMAGIGASGVGAAAVLARPGTLFADNKTTAPANHGVGAVQQEGADWREMDRLHSEGVGVFLDNVGKEEDFWRTTPLEFTMDGEVKVFTLETTNVQWETSPGMAFPAFAYNGRVPGPTIRATEGERIRIVYTNNMDQSHAIHFHGMYVPNDQDGVPFITQPPVEPGATHTYEFTLRNPGTHMYHSHHNAAEQTAGGLMGAFIVDPKDASREPAYDAEYIMVLNDTSLGFTINGRQFPYTQPIVAKLGQKVRIRYMNEGFMIHPMHLHGLPQLVFSKDGWNLPVPYMCDTLNIAPGERYDVIVEASELGVWAYHCHILTHAESRHGMFGMVTVLIVQE
jgi:manganese oxidase